MSKKKSSPKRRNFNKILREFESICREHSSYFSGKNDFGNSRMAAIFMTASEADDIADAIKNYRKRVIY